MKRKSAVPTKEYVIYTSFLTSLYIKKTTKKDAEKIARYLRIHGYPHAKVLEN